MAIVMSLGSNTTGGVRNLRAIFEKKNDNYPTTPSIRGKSLSGSATSSHSRRLSKVRTSFIAVERVREIGGQCQVGLQKSSVKMDNFNSAAGTPGPESNGHDLGAILKGSPFEDTTAAKLITTPNSAKAEKSHIAPSSGAIKKTTTKQIQGNGSKPTSIKTVDDAKHPSPAPSHAKPSPNTPNIGTFPKPRGGGAKIQAVMESARAASEARAAAATTQPESDAPNKDNAPKAATSVLPKAPRVSLPARTARTSGLATAPTASSTAKNDTPSPTESKPADRKPVATRGPPRAASATTASSLAKKSSRASIGSTEPLKPRSNAQKPAADEGFLARMMRPTASSAQKTHEKVQVDSPPRTKPHTGITKTLGKKTSRKSLTGGERDDTAEDPSNTSPIPAIAEEASTPLRKETNVEPSKAGESTPQAEVPHTG